MTFASQALCEYFGILSFPTKICERDIHFLNSDPSRFGILKNFVLNGFYSINIFDIEEYTSHRELRKRVTGSLYTLQQCVTK